MKKKENIYTAIVNAQVDLKNPAKDVKAYNYKYADLASILDQVKPVLKKHGLAVVQLTTDNGNGRVGVTTRLVHTSGESIGSTLTLPIPEMKGVTRTQAAGASITYARRYALSAILNISADEDTDAGALTRDEPTNKKSYPSTPTKKSSGGVTDKQIKYINTLISVTKSDRDKIERVYGKSIKDLDLYEASGLIDQLQKKEEKIKSSGGDDVIEELPKDKDEIVTADDIPF